MDDREQGAYEELSYYTLAHSSADFIHQHIVDAYAAQNVSEVSKPIGIAFALVGLCLHVEFGKTGKQVQAAHMVLARRRTLWPKFALPNDRGPIRVGDVVAVAPGLSRDRMIDAWCRSVWESYRAVHDAVRELARTELGEP